mmetsp:Transcript_3333/g.5082  ORF Transcript_3333/g.5082 Transcript_3333/m.5082 type:complete len:141 (-) Transcript_3333:2298-2720(-)
MNPTWMEAGVITDKAAKSDDAPIPTAFWDLGITTLLNCSSFLLPVLLHLQFRFFLRRVSMSFHQYMQHTHGPSWSSRLHQGGTGGSTELAKLKLDTEAGRRAIQLATNASFWGWDGGSTLFYCRWPTPLGRTAARDGFEI